jgi:hypothetical protein
MYLTEIWGRGAASAAVARQLRKASVKRIMNRVVLEASERVWNEQWIFLLTTNLGRGNMYILYIQRFDRSYARSV